MVLKSCDKKVKKHWLFESIGFSIVFVFAVAFFVLLWRV
jgi:membrane protein YdbS with pleckstrin-like domain